MAVAVVNTAAVVLTCIALAACGFGRQSLDVQGSWEGELGIGQGDAVGRLMNADRRRVHITLLQDGTRLTGSIENPFPGRIAVSGEVALDGAIRLTGSASTRDFSVTISYTGVLDGVRPARRILGSLTQESSFHGETQTGRWNLDLNRR